MVTDKDGSFYGFPITTSGTTSFMTSARTFFNKDSRGSKTSEISFLGMQLRIHYCNRLQKKMDHPENHFGKNFFSQKLLIKNSSHNQGLTF